MSIRAWLHARLVPFLNARSTTMLAEMTYEGRAVYVGYIHRDLIGYTFTIFVDWSNGMRYCIGSGYGPTWKLTNRIMGIQLEALTNYHRNYRPDGSYKIVETHVNFAHAFLDSWLGRLLHKKGWVP